jgi:ABC-2 type transport system ATP-binding protein
MWQLMRTLKETGVTIILTTHYIDEAEEMADRIGIINRGEIVLVEEKTQLLRKLGKKQLTLHLEMPLARVPENLAGYRLELSADGGSLTYTYDDTQSERAGIVTLLRDLEDAEVRFKDLQTKQSSLEDIFVDLVKDKERS